MSENGRFERIKETLKLAAATLRDADVRFMLGGGLAVWAHGGPATDHDLDLMLEPKDADRALEALKGAGMRPEKPPEGWLYKVWDDDVMVDLIFEPTGTRVDDELFARATELEVNAVPMLVMSLEDVLITKLKTLDEHTLDYEPLLLIARALRERIDWDRVRDEVDDSPYAKGFLTLIEELGIVANGRS
jgi:predicted nucleotidyltransferase